MDKPEVIIDNGVEYPLLSDTTATELRDIPCLFCGSIVKHHHYDGCKEPYFFMGLIIAFGVLVLYARIWCAKHKNEY